MGVSLGKTPIRFLVDLLKHTLWKRMSNVEKYPSFLAVKTMLKCQMSFLLNIYADWFCPTMIRYWLCNRKGNYMEQNLIRKQVKLICLYIQAEKFCSRELIFLIWPNLACWTFGSFYRWMMDVGCFQCCHTQVNCLPFTYRKYKNFDLLIILWNCHVCWKWRLLENLLETNEGDRSLVWNQFFFFCIGLL